MRKPLELVDDQMCFGCGRRNRRGLGLKFDLDREKKLLKARWVPTKEFQGYRDIVHGGMIGLVLDEMMVNLLWVLQGPAVSAEFSVKLHRPARVGEALDCESRIEEERGRIFEMVAEAKNEKGERVASATARCLKIEEETE